MGWSFHDLFKAVRSILVYAPSIFFSRCVVKVQETEPWKGRSPLLLEGSFSSGCLEGLI